MFLGSRIGAHASKHCGPTQAQPWALGRPISSAPYAPFKDSHLQLSPTAAWHAGGRTPWEPRTCSPKIGWLDSVAMRMFEKFAGASLSRGRLRLVLPDGNEMEFGSRQDTAPLVKGACGGSGVAGR